MYSKMIALPFPLGHSPLTQIEDISLFKHASFVKGEVGTRIDKYRPLVISLVRKRTPTTLVCSLVLIVELGAQRLAALRLETPSLNKHITLISMQIFRNCGIAAISLLHRNNITCRKANITMRSIISLVTMLAAQNFK